MSAPSQTRALASHSSRDGWPSASGRRWRTRFAAAWAAGLLASLSCVAAAAAPAPIDPMAARHTPAAEQGGADFQGEAASRDVRDVANWIAASGDNLGMPFIIVDKVSARVFLFDGRYRIMGAASALLGLGHGDESVPGIGKRRLATIRPDERTTPAGRFEAALGHDFEQDILWIDYEAAVSLHRVIVGKPAERRHARLASPTPLDNRISYGCINVPASFYDRIVAPAFNGTVGIVYILPETKPIEAVFAMGNNRSSLLSADAPTFAPSRPPAIIP